MHEKRCPPGKQHTAQMNVPIRWREIVQPKESIGGRVPHIPPQARTILWGLPVTLRYHRHTEEKIEQVFEYENDTHHCGFTVGHAHLTLLQA